MHLTALQFFNVCFLPVGFFFFWGGGSSMCVFLNLNYIYVFYGYTTHVFYFFLTSFTSYIFSAIAPFNFLPLFTKPYCNIWELNH